MLARLIGSILLAGLSAMALAAPMQDPAEPPKAESAPEPVAKPAAEPDKPAAEKPETPESPPEEKGGLLLRYKFAPGQTLAFKSRAEFQQRDEANGVSQETTLVREQTDRIKVLELDEKGRAQVEWTIDGLKIDGSFPLGKYQFAADQPPETTTPLGKILTPLYQRTQGLVLRLAIGPQGEFSDLRGYADRVQEVATGHPLAVQCGYGGTNNGLRVALEDLSVIFGDKVIRPGEKWDIPIQLEAPALGRVRGKRVYTLVGPEAPAADGAKADSASTSDPKIAATNLAKLRVQFTTDLQYDIAVEQGDVTVTGKLASTESSGVAIFDPVAGRLESLKSRYKVNGKLSVISGGMTKEISIDQTQSVTVDALPTAQIKNP